MLKLTKIFHFETAHAIHGYPGACKNIHGHSYELHVTVSSADGNDSYLPEPGFVMDFKELKKLVSDAVIERFDHKVLLSAAFVAVNPSFNSLENLVVLAAEPTAENMLLYIKDILKSLLPLNIRLVHLKIFETKDSYAEWTETAAMPPLTGA